MVVLFVRILSLIFRVLRLDKASGEAIVNVNGESQTVINDLVTDEAGNKILYFYERKNWYDAKKHCESLGGSLPTVETKTKNVEVRVVKIYIFI